MRIVGRFPAFLLLVVSFRSFAQMPAPAKESAKSDPPQPLVVDVHPAPYQPGLYYSANISNQRYDLRNATMLDLIAIAYDRDRDDSTILGGPTWIELDRFDLAAKIDSLRAPKSNPVMNATPSASTSGPAKQEGNPYDQIRPVLRDVLTQRFHLAYHTEDKPLPGYIITVVKGGNKMTEAKQPSDSPNCHGAQDKDTPGRYTMTCTSMTMAQFITYYGGIFPHRVVDQTGLTK